MMFFKTNKYRVCLHATAVIAVALFLIGTVLIGATYALEVKVAASEGKFQLLIDGKSYYIKGVGCGEDIGNLGDDYLRLAKEMGANTVRTWGTDQGNSEYLDRAASYGLKVVAGIWLNWVASDGSFSYIRDKAYMRDKRKEIIDYVRRYRNHPAILMWNVGNEAIFFTEKEEERIALCKYLNDICRQIHKIDHKHPVVYAAAGTSTLKYLKQYVPSLDVIGINTYSSVRFVQAAWENLKFDKPYMLTEFGPRLAADLPKDANGLTIELSDKEKAMCYRDYTEQMLQFAGTNVGGFAFHLGETTQESITWWNINEHSFRRLAFWKIYSLYTQKPITNFPPQICSFKLSQAKVKPGEEILIEVTAQDKESEPLTYAYKVSTGIEGVLSYYVNTDVQLGPAQGNNSLVKIKMPEKKGLYRVYAFVYDKSGNATSANATVKVTDE